MYKFVRLFSSTYENSKKNVNNLISILGKIIDNDDLLYDVRLVTSELIANGIEHGNCMDSNCTIYLEIELDEHYIYIRVEDEGDCFEGGEFGLYSPDDCECRGRGLFIVGNIADQVNIVGKMVEAKIAIG
ncbi:MAG: ATP-binding protein [Finegoldia sp.]|nr:ATP-binding protein [Finegoldia sp.]